MFNSTHSHPRLVAYGQSVRELLCHLLDFYSPPFHINVRHARLFTKIYSMKFGVRRQVQVAAGSLQETGQGH